MDYQEKVVMWRDYHTTKENLQGPAADTLGQERDRTAATLMRVTTQFIGNPTQENWEKLTVAARSHQEKHAQREGLLEALILRRAL